MDDAAAARRPVRDPDMVERTEPYEPPCLIRLGTLAELTRGNDTQRHTDGTFPGSTFL
jgi:hypothetical protein